MTDFASVDAGMEELVRNVEKLRSGLKVWQTWDAEYEELKEELQSMSDDASVSELNALSESFDGRLLDSQAIRNIIGLDEPPLRSPFKAVRLIEQRQDYVQRNVVTLSTQLAKAEFALADMAPQDQQVPHDVSDEPANHLPIYDIVEQLDDQGNVTESKMYRPDSVQDKIQDMLNKAGVKMDNSDAKMDDLHERTDTSEVKTVGDNENVASTSPTTPASHEDDVQDASSPPSPQRPSRPDVIGRKSVSFAKDTKPPSEPSRSSSATSNRSESKSVSFSNVVDFQPPEEPRVSFSSVVQEIDSKEDTVSPKLRDLSKTFAPGSRVIELDDDDNAVDNVVIPDNETPEEAQLRRQMLAYSLNEVGSVVAELELEEDYSDDEFEDDSQFDYTDGTTLSDVEDDDEHGRTKTRVITDEYRRRMLELEKKLDAKALTNVGPNMPDDDDMPGPEPRHAHRLVVRDTDPDTDMSRDGAESDSSSKKSVRFADTLHVHHVDAKPSDRMQPIMSNIVESPDFAAPTSDPPAAKTSRFKAARQAAGTASKARDEPRPIIMEDVMERPIVDTPRAPKAETDDDIDDPEIRQRQLASEYYRLRNSIIRNQEGGFKESPEEAYEPLMEEKEGRVRKVSRFRAARVGGYKPDEE